MDEQLASSSRNARERRQIQALERIAKHLEVISTTLGMWYSHIYDDCELRTDITAEENAESMKKLRAMLGVKDEEE